jgi:hypothetical protein
MRIKVYKIDYYFSGYEVDSSVIELFNAMESGESDLRYVSLALPPESINIGVALIKREPTPLKTTQELLDELVEVAEKTEVVTDPDKPRCVLTKTPAGLMFLFW